LKTKIYDVLIVGAGPAGAASALKLGQAGLSVAILDKAKFPRDKICGDALSVDVLNQLPLLSDDLARAFDEFALKTPSFGVKIFAPYGGFIEIPFFHNGKAKSGYICTRVDFDNLLVHHLKKTNGVSLFENCRVNNITPGNGCLQVQTNAGTFAGKIVIGADGAQSTVSKRIQSQQAKRKHYSAGLRVYYEGIDSFHGDNFIELYFFRETLPGYLWIFPLPHGKANVGIGMLSSVISRKKINLKENLHQLLTTHPLLKERFHRARPIEIVKGFGLPLGSQKRKISGDRTLLVGDAAGLIDPFTGEGIGNAIRSGRVAADHIKNCFASNDFSAAFNRQYDNEIYRRMWGEFKISKSLQGLSRSPRLFNFVVRKASQSNSIQQLLIDALDHIGKKKLLTRPGFYYRLLFH
jgi:geranylgeranyl reductase family protein